MGTYTDFVVGTEAEIKAAFSWLFPVVEEDVEPRPLINPFTKEPILDPSTGKPQMPSKRIVVQVPADADAEGRPTAEDMSRMGKLPHLLWKNVSMWELSILCETLLGEGDWLSTFTPFLLSAEQDFGVYRIPSELLVALSKLSNGERDKAGLSWLGHEDLRDSWRAEDGPVMVKELSGLATVALQGSKGVFLQM